MKAGAKSVYFESGCEKLACETFKSLDSCAVHQKRMNHTVTIEQTRGERQEEGKNWALAKTDRNVSIGSPVPNWCCKKFINPSNQSLTSVIMHWLTGEVVIVFNYFLSICLSFSLLKLSKHMIKWQIIRKKEAIFPTPQKSYVTIFWGADYFILVQLILFMQKNIKKLLSGYFLVAVAGRCNTKFFFNVQNQVIPEARGNKPFTLSTGCGVRGN